MSVLSVDRAQVVYPFVGSRQKCSEIKQNAKKKHKSADNSENYLHRWRIRDVAK